MRFAPRIGFGCIIGFMVWVGLVPCTQAAVLRVPQTYATIQDGIAAARAGDTVVVAPGVYFESITLKPGVHLYGEAGAILDGSQGTGALVRATGGVDQTAVLSGFVVRRSRQAGILLNQAAPTLRNNVIAENVGPGIVCAQASPLVVNNVLVANAGGGMTCEYPGTAPIIKYNVFWNNHLADVQGCKLGDGNRYEEPGFLNAPAGNYRLAPTSPLIDAGDPQAQWMDRDGSRSDIGVYGGPLPPVEPSRPSEGAGVFASLFDTPGILRNSLSTWGLPGIIHVPTATMVPEGSVDVAYNNARDPQVFPGVERQKNFNFALGFLPRLTIGGRGTVPTDAQGMDLAGDISANIQLQLLEDRSWWPAVAVGLQDVSGGAQFFRSRYVVLSKSLFGRVRGTVGFGAGPDVLDGPFAGVELALNRFITVLGEYDTQSFNGGLRLFPLPEAWEAYGIPRPTVDVLWQEGQQVSWGIHFRSVLGEAKFQAQREVQAQKRYRRPASEHFAEVSLQTMSERLQAELIDRGLENVRITVARLEPGLTVVVEYENRRYNRDELDALGLVFGLAALRTPPPITHMRAIVKEVNIPVLDVSTNVETFLAFLNEQMPASAFAQQLHITQDVRWPVPGLMPEAVTSIGERSWLKMDVILRPGIETLILTELGVADIRFRLFPDAFVQLTPGTVLNVRGTIPVVKTEAFDEISSSPGIDRALVHQSLRIPLGGWPPGLTQFSIGRFNAVDHGIANETAFTFAEGRFFVKGTLARLGSSFSALDRWVALGNGRVRYPALDLTLSVTAGRFVNGDQGVAVDLGRFFGNTEIGVFFRHSENGSQAGLRLGIPLTPAKELPPWRVRPRLPELFAYEQSTTVLTRSNFIRGDIGQSLRTGHEVERVYWNRDRLYPVYIWQHVDTLRQAVRRWIDATS